MSKLTSVELAIRAAAELGGTCHDRGPEFEGMDFNTFDSLVFRCAACDMWCDLIDESGDHADICRDCE